MTVSDKMVHQVADGYDIANAQEVVNAAWTEFNPDAESTWPTEINKVYSVEIVYEGKTYFEYVFWVKGNVHNHFSSAGNSFIVRYADPQDLMFKEI